MAFKTPLKPKNPVDGTLVLLSEGFFVEKVNKYSKNEYR
jgi:hypothetical protein